MKRGNLVATVGIAGMFANAAAADTVWDNGPPDGSNGYSNGKVDAFNGLRTLLDDFTLSSSVVLQDFHWQHIWNTFPAGSGSGMELTFRSDAGNAPGDVVAKANITSYSEVGTGVTYFNRPGAESWVTFDDIILGPGTFWFEARIVGPENNFWLIHERDPNLGSECWVNYDDLGGLQPGVDIFGVAADLNFILTAVPVPGALALLGLAVLAGRRRRE